MNDNQVFDFADIHSYQVHTRYDTLRGLVAVSNTRPTLVGTTGAGGLRGPQRSGLQECTVLLQRFSRFRKREEEKKEVAAGERTDSPLDPPAVLFCGHFLAIFLWSEFADASQI
jgi:hypothetical protein